MGDKKYFITVDDEELIRDSFRDVVEMLSDYNVLGAKDGEEGFSLLEGLADEKPKTIMVTDHGMPNLNGLEMIRKIKEFGLMEKFGDNLRIYMNFSPAREYGEEIGKEAVGLGAREYILKPKLDFYKVKEILDDFK
ncbi:MAG: response regulator [archaeon]